MPNKNPKCKSFVGYKNPKTYDQIFGLEAEKGKIFKWVKYNQFEDKHFTIPKGYKKMRSNQYDQEMYCGNKKTLDEINFNKWIHTGYKQYVIYNNMEAPFLACVKSGFFGFGEKSVTIYKVPDDIYLDENPPNYVYNEFVKKFEFDKIFVPEGYSMGNDNFKSGGDKGNTLLLKVKDKYIFIGTKWGKTKRNVLDAFQFTANDEIEEYYSPMGHSFVPYPVAFGNEFVYFMDEKTVVPLKYFEKINVNPLTNEEESGLKKRVNAYAYYSKIKKYAKKMKNYKVLHS